LAPPKIFFLKTVLGNLIFNINENLSPMTMGWQRGSIFEIKEIFRLDASLTFGWRKIKV